MIHDLFRWYGRVELFALPRWLLGFDVPIGEVRRLILTHTENFLMTYTQGATTPDELEDRLDDSVGHTLSSWKYSGRIPKHFLTLDEMDRYMLMDAITHLLASQDYQPDEFTLVELLEAFVTINQQEMSESILPPLLATIQKATDFVSSHFSLPRLRDAVRDATTEDWHLAQQDFIALCSMLKHTYRLIKTQINFPPLPIEWQYNALAKSGLYIIPLLLALHQDGYEDWIDWAIARAREALADP